MDRTTYLLRALFASEPAHEVKGHIDPRRDARGGYNGPRIDPTVRRLNQDIEMGNFRPTVRRSDYEAFSALHVAGSACKHKDLPAVLWPTARPAGENLPRPDSVEFFNAIEQHDPDRAHAPYANCCLVAAPFRTAPGATLVTTHGLACPAHGGRGTQPTFRFCSSAVQ